MGLSERQLDYLSCNPLESITAQFLTPGCKPGNLMKNPSMIFEILKAEDTALNAQNGIQPVLLQRRACCCQEQSLLLQRTALEQISRPFLRNKSSHLQGKTKHRSGSATLSCSNIHTHQEGWTLLKWCFLVPKLDVQLSSADSQGRTQTLVPGHTQHRFNETLNMMHALLWRASTSHTDTGSSIKLPVQSVAQL